MLKWAAKPIWPNDGAPSQPNHPNQPMVRPQPASVGSISTVREVSVVSAYIDSGGAKMGIFEVRHSRQTASLRIKSVSAK